jgi:hypothetical protein
MADELIEELFLSPLYWVNRVKVSTANPYLIPLLKKYVPTVHS